MIVSSLTGHDYRYAQTEAEISVLISELMGDRDSMRSEAVGHIVEMSCTDRRLEEMDGWPARSGRPNNQLSVSVNTATGHGALVWFVTRRFPKKGGIYDDVWVTDNPCPPAFDTRVLSDTHTGECYDLRSTLPLPGIRAAVVEFCRVGTGDRPTSVNWAEAVDLVGRRVPIGPADPGGGPGDSFGDPFA